MSPRNSLSNLFGILESQQQLEKFDSSPERIDSLHNASDIEECPQQQFNRVLDETVTVSNSSSQEQANDVSTIQECSERLNELPCGFTSPDKPDEGASDPVRESCPQIAIERLTEELTESNSPEISSPIEPMESEIPEQQPNKELDIVDKDDTDNVSLSQEITEANSSVSDSKEDTIKGILL